MLSVLKSSISKIMHKRSGFTLIEMLVVLAILAAVTTLAIRSAGNLQSQARYQQTTREMEDISAAIIGTAHSREPDGTAQVTGFVADMGRLPRAVGSDPLTQLQELWIQPAGAVLYGARSPSFDSSVTIVSGWRGPYLLLGMGKTELRDGWGNPFDLLKADQTTVVNAGDAVEVLRSRGSDNAVDASIPTVKDYNTDVYAGLNVTSMPTNSSGQTVSYAASIGNRFQGQISGNISFFDATSGTYKPLDSTKGDIVVCYYGPNPATGDVNTITITFSATSAPLNANPSSLPYAFAANFPIGPCVIRAYQGNSLSNATFATYKSQVTRLVLLPGGQTKDLVLQ